LCNGPGSSRAVHDSNVKEQYDALSRLQLKTFSLPSREIDVAFLSFYKSHLIQFQSPRELAEIASSDLKVLYRATMVVSFTTDDAAVALDAMRDAQELSRRGAASQQELEDTYSMLVAERLFSNATAFRIRQRLTTEDPLPAYVDGVSGTKSGPTELVLSRDMKTIVRRSADIASAHRIIIVSSPFCHFCQRAIRAIEDDPGLRDVIRKNATWLIVPDANLKSIHDWNQQYPRERMTLTYRESEWPMLDQWATPTFYFFSHGTLVSKISGWPIEGRRTEMLEAFRKVGLEAAVGCRRRT
jgi:hypothetical protein